MAGPLDHFRRTPLRRTLEARGAAWRHLDDVAVAERVDSAPPGAPLGIADLSPLPRLGFKGPGTIEAARPRGVVLEPNPNRGYRQPDGGLCLVLAPGEILLLSNLKGDGARLAEIERTWRIEDEERTYPVPRRDSHAWLALAGASVPAMLAKLCAVDLRLHKFADLSIAQTSVARMSAIVVRADLGVTPVFHLLADSAAAVYFFGCLEDAAQEFGGRVVGLAFLLDLQST